VVPQTVRRMPTLRCVSLLAYAAVVVACSAVPEAPPVPNVPSTSAPVAPVAPVAVATEAPKPKSLKAAMEGIEEDWHLLEKQVVQASDLPATAAAAERIAKVMHLAYDPWEDKEVPDFGKLAREAEAAFLELAKKAAAGDAEAVKAMGKTLQLQHCARCHDAVEAVHG
jgi:hypothetical protein